jgi:hypothetical protein
VARWTGREGPLPWPTCSLDIIPLDFFMWGYVKNITYHSPITSINDLKRYIMDSIMTIHADMLLRTWQVLDYQLDIIHATKGAHSEVYYGKLKTLKV